MTAPLMPGASVAGALAMAAMLALSAGSESLYGGTAELREMRPGSLLWVVLAMLAIASAVFGVIDPQAFAMACSEGFKDPGSIAAAVGG